VQLPRHIDPGLHPTLHYADSIIVRWIFVVTCRGVTKFERHCAENDVDIPFEVVSQLYKNPHDMSVLGDNNKLKLMARCIIMETVDEQYSR
jgi:hypothetical protein